MLHKIRLTTHSVPYIYIFFSLCLTSLSLIPQHPLPPLPPLSPFTPSLALVVTPSSYSLPFTYVLTFALPVIWFQVIFNSSLPCLVLLPFSFLLFPPHSSPGLLTLSYLLPSTCVSSLAPLPAISEFLSLPSFLPCCLTFHMEWFFFNIYLLHAFLPLPIALSYDHSYVFLTVCVCVCVCVCSTVTRDEYSLSSFLFYFLFKYGMKG